MVALVLVVLTIAIWSAMILNQGQQALRVAFLDVGQGDAVFIEAPNGTQMLIDGGAGSAVLSKLGEVMPWWDRSIDVVLATHPDMDHIGGRLDTGAGAIPRGRTALWWQRE